MLLVANSFDNSRVCSLRMTALGQSGPSAVRRSRKICYRRGNDREVNVTNLNTFSERWRVGAGTFTVKTTKYASSMSLYK